MGTGNNLFASSDINGVTYSHLLLCNDYLTGTNKVLWLENSQMVYSRDDSCQF